MAKAKKNAEAQEKQTPQEQSKQTQKPVQKKPKKYRSLSRFIEVFEYKGIRYTIYPNAVVENLPEDAPQVQRLIEQKKLVEVK
ncbi:hypothetical protein [Thermovibrio sp.]